VRAVGHGGKRGVLDDLESAATRNRIALVDREKVEQGLKFITRKEEIMCMQHKQSDSSASGMYCSNGSHPVYTDYCWEENGGHHIATYNGEEVVQKRDLGHRIDLDKLGFEPIEIEDAPDEIRSLATDSEQPEEVDHDD
jgi:hypothetical protein